MDLKALIRTVPDFPKPGISFKDITPLLRDAAAFRCAVEALARRFGGSGATVVTGPESRGFILASAVALRLGCGFVPVRKPGKLPWHTRRITYALEYGEDALEVHADAFATGQKVLVVDDVLATGGTVRATIDLVEQQGAQVVGVGFLIELTALGGRARLGGYDVYSLLQY